MIEPFKSKGATNNEMEEENRIRGKTYRSIVTYDSPYSDKQYGNG